jgi:hypothetical protein
LPKSIFLADIISEDDAEESTQGAQLDAETLPVKRSRQPTNKFKCPSETLAGKTKTPDAVRLQNSRDQKKKNARILDASNNAKGVDPDSGHMDSSHTPQGPTAQQCQQAQRAQPAGATSATGRLKCKPTTSQRVGSGNPSPYECLTVTIFKRTSGGTAGTADSHVTGSNSKKSAMAFPEVLDPSGEASCALAADEFMRRSPTFSSGKNVFLQKNFTY